MYKLPDANYILIDKKLYFEMPHFDSIFIHLGVAPKPIGAFNTFIYHVCNGILKQYPIIEILKFSWKNRNSFR